MHLFQATLLPSSNFEHRETEFRVLVRSQSGDWERGGGSMLPGAPQALPGHPQALFPRARALLAHAPILFGDAPARCGHPQGWLMRGPALFVSQFGVPVSKQGVWAWKFALWVHRQTGAPPRQRRGRHKTEPGPASPRAWLQAPGSARVLPGLACTGLRTWEREAPSELHLNYLRS